MTRRATAIVFLFTVILPFVGPQRAEALWLDTLTTYYTGPCENLTYNGYRWKECDGTITQSGTLSGTWRCDDVYDCAEGGGLTYHWYERCNNTWVYRYTSGSSVNRFPTSADCQCT